MTAIPASLSHSDFPLLDRCKQWVTYRFNRTAVNQIAENLTEILKKMPRLTPSRALESDEVRSTRQFFKRIHPKFKTDLKVQRCYRQFLAAKLGIKEELFQKNFGFYEFSKKNALERYLNEYGDSLEVKENQIHIRYKGKMQPWEFVSSELKTLPEPKSIPKQSWVYGKKGIQKESMFVWKEWMPYKKVENPSWGNRYIFEMCVCCEDASLRLAGDHNWFRLKAPNGDIYSAGKNLDSKLQGEGGFQLPFRARDAYIMSPDVSEFFPTPIHRLEVEITEGQFQAIKNSVNEDKKNENDLHIQVMGENNCLTYMMSKAKLAGIEIPTSQSVFRAIAPAFLVKGYDFLMEKLPQVIKKVIDVVGAIFGNLVMLILGNGSVDSNLKLRNVSVKPRISSVADLVNSDNLHFHPPTYFKLTIDELKQWQQDNSKPYALPEKYYANV